LVVYLYNDLADYIKENQLLISHLKMHKKKLKLKQ